MFPPDPLHPAIVHFPIVFLILGVFFVFLSLFVHRKEFIILYSLFFALGALGVYVSLKTGGIAATPFLNAFPQITPDLEVHAQWGRRTFRVANVTAGLGIFSLFVFHKKIIFRIFQIITALAALVLVYCLYQTSTLGGHMVYHEALGLEVTKDIQPTP